MTAGAMKADAMKADAIAVTKADATARAADQRSDVGHAVAPPLAPSEPALDLAHLSRMTLGESSLEREVLDLFDRQADALLARMASEEPRKVAELAHTLAGSASGIGAWKVAETATAVERAASESGAIALTGVMDHLVAAVAEVHAAIGELSQAD
jgi:HPt (histidine-containing phosphotransfer) domain-containing protein